MFIEKVRDGLWRIVWSSAGYTGPEYFNNRRSAVNFGTTLLQTGGNVSEATDLCPVGFQRLCTVEKSTGRGTVKKTAIVFTLE